MTSASAPDPPKTDTCIYKKLEPSSSWPSNLLLVKRATLLATPVFQPLSFFYCALSQKKMAPRRVILVALVALSFAFADSTFFRRRRDAAAPVFTMCVPQIYWKDCVQMIEDSGRQGIPIACIAGRDRYDCIEKVGRKEADIVAVDPEDMYLAGKNRIAAEAGYNLVEQIRTKEEPDAPYRYEAVAVIHKDQDINSPQGLRGLKSCHTGIGRNVGYKIPITKLTAMGLLTNLSDPRFSSRENELRALSNFFSEGCLVGSWSADPDINQRLKASYSNLCARCKNPQLCDYPDEYSGYEGALKCLAFGGGQVAWTKVIFVKRFFGLPVGNTPAKTATKNPADFRYFCPDGSKVPIDAETKPCVWAARPWQGYMVNGGVSNIKAVQDEITGLGSLGEQKNASWWKDLMLLDTKTLPVKTDPIQPLEHLNKANYTDVIERDFGGPMKSAKWCVWSTEALDKCNAFARAAFSRDVRPKLECLLEKDVDTCLKSVKDGKADIVSIDGGLVDKAMKEYDAKPIIAEKYGEGATKESERPAVAVVKKTSSINNLVDLKGKKSCHNGYKGSFAGWSAPVHALKATKQITNPDDLAEFFSGSCAPGAPQQSKLCSQCAGNIASGSDKIIQETKCKPIEAEAFNGDLGALRCLIAGNGDVAFVSYTALFQLDKLGTPDQIPKGSDFELLCANGGRAPIEDGKRCNLGVEPPRVIVISGSRSENARREFIHGILDASSTYAESPELFSLFGNWDGKSNLIFKDDAIDLKSVDDTWESWGTWATTQQEYNIAS
ncbi:transferrin [Neodiprion virginianus]|uniref:transferrin n=1 Tax=Neodiprion virginianus TaxID=2961670 RepID=UPI001EE7577A|nr:transferrin [Neodiprion virginianus]